MQSSNSSLKLVLHAPTAASLKRAKSNAANVRRELPDAQIRIIANAEGVSEALIAAPDDADQFTSLCANTLRKLGKDTPPRFGTVPSGVVAIAQLQQDGWLYVRA
jgi:intracellular sulfur oxidation DsrE/DsrF family protein